MINSIKPPLGITAKVEYISNYDGDTIDVEFKQKIKIRVTDKLGKFDTPEKGYRAKHDAEKYLANLAESRTRELLKNSEIHIHIPDSKPLELGTSFAVGTRIAGIVYFLVDSVWYDLSQVLIKEELTKYHANILNDIELCVKQDRYITTTLPKDLIFKELIMKVGPLKNDYSQLTSTHNHGNFVNYINNKYNINASQLFFVKGFEQSYLGIYEIV